MNVDDAFTTRKNTDDFCHFVVEQLNVLPELTIRRMFGGYGLYQGGYFFAIIAGGRLYFKTSPKTRTSYEALGMEPFRPNEKQTLKNYYEVPVSVIEDSVQLTEWAWEAVEVTAGS